MSSADTLTGIFDSPLMAGVVIVRDLLPASGTMRLSEGMHAMFHMPPTSPAPEFNPVFDVITRRGRLTWRILVGALPNKVVGDPHPRLAPLIVKAPPAFLTR